MAESVDELFVDVIGRLDESSIRQLQRRLEDVSEEAGEQGGNAITRGMGGALAALPALAGAAALGVGAALAAGTVSIVNLAGDAAENVRRFQAELGATSEEAEKLGAAAEQVFGNTIGTSLGDAGEAVKNVKSELKGLADDEIAAVTTATLKIGQTFEEEQADVASAVAALMQSTGASAEEALDFITKGFQDGLNSSGDFLDTIKEYGPQFQKAGFTAEQAYSLMQSGAAKGALGVDKVADGLKEFGIRFTEVNEGSIDAFKQLGLNQEELIKQYNEGKITIADVFTQVQGRIKDVKGEADKAEIGKALAGSAYEDLAPLWDGVDITGTKMADLRGSTDKLAVKYTSFGALGEALWKKITLALLPVGKEILGLANEAMPYLEKAINSTLPFIQEMAAYFSAAIKAFKEGKGEAEGSISGIGEIFKNVSEIARNVFGTLGPYFSSVVQGITPIFASLAPLVGSVFNTISALWQTVLKPVLDFIAPAFKLAFGLASAQIKGFVDLASGVLNALASLIRGDTSGAVKILGETVQRVGADMQRAFNGAVETIIGTLRGLGDNLRQLGNEMVAGLIAGIYERINSVKNAAGNLAKSFLDQAKKVLIVRSPSKAMQAIGEFVGQGFVNGIASKDKEVKKAAQGIAKAALDSLKNLKLENQTGILSLDSYIKTLEKARDTLQAKLKTVGEGSPAYGQWLGALSKVTKELESLTGKSSDAAKQAKKLADELARNKERIAAIEATEKYNSALRKASDTQLKSALSAAKNAGELNKYNAIRAEQKRRIDAVRKAEEKGKKAAEDYAKAQELAFKAAEKTIEQLEKFNLGGLDAKLNAPDAVTDTSKTFEDLSLRIARLRSELQKDGVFDTWVNELKRMRSDGELTEQQLNRLLKQLQAINSPNFVGPSKARGVDNGPLTQPAESGAVAARGEGVKEVKRVAEEAAVAARVVKGFDEAWADLMADLGDAAVLKEAKDRVSKLSDAQLVAAINTAKARKDVLGYTVATEEQAKRTKDAADNQAELADIIDKVSAASQKTQKPLSEQLARLRELKKESPELAKEIGNTEKKILALQAAAAKEEELKRMQDNLKKLSSDLSNLGGKINQVVGIFSKFGGEVAGAADIVGTYFTTNLKAAQQAMQGDYAGAVLTTIEGIINIGDKLQELDPAYQLWKKNLNETGELIKKNMGPKVVNGVINPFFDSLERDLRNRTELANANWMQRWWWNNFGDAPEVLDKESAILLSEISAIFNKVATGATGAIQDELLNAFNSGDWESATENMSRRVQQSIAKIALDYIIQTSELAPKIAKFSEFFRKAIVGGLTPEEKAELNRLYNDIVQEQKRIAGRYRAIAEDLPGYGREARDQQEKELIDQQEKIRDEYEKTRKKREELDRREREAVTRPRRPETSGGVTPSTDGRLAPPVAALDLSPITNLQAALTTLGPQLERSGQMLSQGADRFSRAVDAFDRRVNWSALNRVDN